VVIGHPDYYPRFGYQRASHWGITFVFEVPDDVAMAVELKPGALNGVSGVARLSEAFGPDYT
jgi:predicted N-acetyltransferase YhbS